MDMINQLITNEVFIVCFVSWFASQFIKTTITLFKDKRFDIKQLLIGMGGMPSSHTAVVCGMTASVLLVEGVTTLFIVTLMFAIVIVRDSMGVRRESGKHAALLNKLTSLMYKKKEKTKLNELTGHTPLQVLLGAVIGILVAVLII